MQVIDEVLESLGFFFSYRMTELLKLAGTYRYVVQIPAQSHVNQRQLPRTLSGFRLFHIRAHCREVYNRVGMKHFWKCDRVVFACVSAGLGAVAGEVHVYAYTD